MYSYDEDSTAHRDRVLYCFRSIVIRLQSRLNRDRLDLNSDVFTSKSNHVSHSFYDLLHDREKILVKHFLLFLFFALVDDEDDDVAIIQLRLRRCRDSAHFKKLSCFVSCLDEKSDELLYRCRVACESNLNENSLFQTMK
jgi:hypothetical protein